MVIYANLYSYKNDREIPIPIWIIKEFLSTPMSWICMNKKQLKKAEKNQENAIDVYLLNLESCGEVIHNRRLGGIVTASTKKHTAFNHPNSPALKYHKKARLPQKNNIFSPKYTKKHNVRP